MGNYYLKDSMGQSENKHREEDTVSKGHLLRPRYLTYADGDFEDVAAVLEKILRYIKE